MIPEYEKFLKQYKAMTNEEQKKFREEVMQKQKGLAVKGI